MKTFRSSTLLVIAVAAFAMVIVLTAFILLPFDHAVRSIAKSIEQQQVLLALNALEQRQASATQRQFDRFQTVTSAIDRELLTETNALDFVTAIELVASRNNITETMSGLKAPTAAGQQVPLQFTLNGSYHNLRLALADVQRMPYFIVIHKMTWVVSAAGTASPATIQLTLDATIAWK